MSTEVTDCSGVEQRASCAQPGSAVLAAGSVGSSGRNAGWSDAVTPCNTLRAQGREGAFRLCVVSSALPAGLHAKCPWLPSFCIPPHAGLLHPEIGLLEAVACTQATTTNGERKGRARFCRLSWASDGF